MSLKILNQSPNSSPLATIIPMLPPQHLLTIIHYFAHGRVISHPSIHTSSSSFKPLIIPILEKQKDRKNQKNKTHNKKFRGKKKSNLHLIDLFHVCTYIKMQN
jgi:hypothetical protein